MWLCGELHLLLELPRRLTAGFLKRSVYPRVDFLKKRLRTAVQLVAMQCQHVIELRLKADQGVLLHKDINVGVAVSVDDGLIVPVIHQADRMSISGLAKATDDLAKRARAGKLGIPDVQGATFTVNNPGTFGTILSYSIIAPPQAGILAMDAIVKRPVVVEGDAIAIRSMMNLCLSFDHRVLDGVSAARFLQGVRRWLEGFSEQIPLY